MENQTVADVEYYQEGEPGQPFEKLLECVIHLNELPRLKMSARVVDNKNPKMENHPRAIIRGRYAGMIYNENNKKLGTIRNVIESYGFTVLRVNFVEEDDEGFTFLSLTIKNQ